MLAVGARRSTVCLQLAALQFLVLTSVSITLYPEYRFADQFLSELGATRTAWGVPNRGAAALFGCALGILGVAMVVFAAAWRDYAFERGRARWLGVASQVCGTVSGLAFVTAACTPIDIALAAHNSVVVAAFGLLLGFAACTTALWSRNGAPAGVVVAGATYAAILVVYFGAVAWAVASGLFAHRRVLIVGQKIVVAASLGYIVYLTLVIRRRAWAVSSAT
jgi:hypothetical protein